ncbi:MAG: hypothetical protein MJA27_02330 [Pseudanabaenales cyanobacterium]|nr:hypothetical protein [Pseudanabaenales cyanobacterium]
MKTQQLIASLTFSALFLFPGMARADNINIRTNTTRVTVSPRGDIYINTQPAGLGSRAHQLRPPVYTRPRSTRLNPPNSRSTCHGAHDHYQRTYTSAYGSGRSYTHSSTVTRVCR